MNLHILKNVTSKITILDQINFSQLKIQLEERFEEDRSKQYEKTDVDSSGLTQRDNYDKLPNMRGTPF